MDMKCEGCVNAVKNKLETVEGSFFLSLFKFCSCFGLFKFLLLVVCDGIGKRD